jgi:hypothetical protein
LPHVIEIIENLQRNTTPKIKQIFKVVCKMAGIVEVVKGTN